MSVVHSDLTSTIAALAAAWQLDPKPPQVHLDLDRDGVLLLIDEDGETAQRLGHVLDPDSVPMALCAEWERLRSDYRDSLSGGHEAEAGWVYDETRGV